MKKTELASTTILALFLASFPGRAQEVSERDKFELWDNCKQVDALLLSDEDADYIGIGLTKEGIEFAARSKLRDAGLYSHDAPYSLVFSIIVLNTSTQNDEGVEELGSSFGVQVSYYKTVDDSATGKNDLAITWDQFVVGASHDANAAEKILTVVADLTETFITEYIRVNHEACSGTAPESKGA